MMKLFLLIGALILITGCFSTGQFKQVRLGSYSTGSATKGSNCIESWTCTEWSDCSPTGVQTRDCTDNNDCGTTMNMPSIARSCN